MTVCTARTLRKVILFKVMFHVPRSVSDILYSKLKFNWHFDGLNQSVSIKGCIYIAISIASDWANNNNCAKTN